MRGTSRRLALSVLASVACAGDGALAVVDRIVPPWSRWLALIAAVGLSVFLMPDARAQSGTTLLNTPAEKFVIAPGGVDLRTGRFVYKQIDLSIGGTDESGGLSLTRTMVGDVAGHVNPFGNLTHNWDIMLTERRVSIDHPTTGCCPDYRMNVHFGGRSETFESYSNQVGFSQVSQGAYASLSYVGDRAGASAVYTFRAADGTTVVFRPLGNSDCALRCAYVSQVVEPDGTTFSFDYAAAGGGGSRLKRVTSSRGYAVMLEGGGNVVTKACVLNLTQTIAPANDLCPSAALSTTSYGYSMDGSGRLASVTRPDGKIESFTYATDAGGRLLMGFVKPGQTAAWLTNSIAIENDEEQVPQEIVYGQTYASGQTYTYGYMRTPPTDNKPNTTIAGGSYSGTGGQGMGATYDFPIRPGANTPGSPCTLRPCLWPMPDDPSIVYQQTPGPIEIVDAIGRTTTFDYCDPVAMTQLPPLEHNRCIVLPVQSFTDPEGIKTQLTYDGNRNIVRAVRHAKPESGLADIVTSATFDTGHLKSANKPLTMTDANGNTITYSYSPDHGGMLTETHPAVNGVTPQKRYTYAQRTAWVSNGAGGWAAAGPPVWVLASTSTCKAGNPAPSGGGCVLAGDEVVTLYDYGPDAGPNNLNLRGLVLDPGGLNLRTCYAYDGLGNKLSETTPRAGLATCP